MISRRFTIEKRTTFRERLSDVTFSRRSIFFQRATAFSNFVTDTTLAVEISPIFTSATDAKLAYS
jgi:hypothetical protein